LQLEKPQKLSVLFDIPTEKKKWVDSIYNVMTFDEKVGQLFMVAVYSNKDNDHYSAVEKLITENKIGVILFF
jgi:quinol-cytochrome oxidoreductase complex cytochrome b subunit